MEFVQVKSQVSIQIQSYVSGCVTINNIAYRQSMLVFPDKIEPWSVQGMADFNEASCAALKVYGAEVILVGTGATLIFPPTSLFQYIRTEGFAIEWMDTAAACRTFQVLASEHRNVLAALIV